MFTELIKRDNQTTEENKSTKRKSTNKRRTLEELNSFLVGTGFECVDNNLKTERTFPSAYGMYKFPCGHLQESKHDYVRSGGVRCRTCFTEEKQKEAEQQGITYVGEDPSGRANYRVYKLPCGHNRSLTLHHVREGVFSELCGDCTTIKYAQDAERNNLILVTDFNTGRNGYRKYIYQACGHTRCLPLSRVAKDQTPPCDVCTRLRWENEARSFGIEMLDLPPKNVEGVNYFSYKLHCGCVKQATTGDVRKQAIGCSVHSTYWNKSATLYFVKFNRLGKEWLKVGVSSNETRRFNEYFRGEDYTIDKILSLSFDSLYFSTVFEKSIHKYFKKERIHKEELRPLMKSGFNECYPVEMLEKIKSKILADYKGNTKGNSE